ncbi:hypothetical protein GCM10009765_83550 [Fodinicola feengrottensis]|uniref:Uncharacterized protein n=1 Tax=Fodinicola feengrottensis TaxID=435914 RepID=A0ABN2JCY6_9ACTN
MAMLVSLRDERENLIEMVASDPALGWVVPYLPPGEFPMIGHIDPYGNTIFNRSQMRALRAEIDVCRTDERVKPGAVEFLLEISRLCELGDKRPHKFLWFLGD